MHRKQKQSVKRDRKYMRFSPNDSLIIRLQKTTKKIAQKLHNRTQLR